MFFFVSELGTYLQCRVYTLIVDVNFDRISYLRHRAFIHFNIHTRHFYLPSPSSSGPRLARTSVHNNRLYLWFQFSHCTALLTVLTAASGVWDIVNCGSRSLSQISPVSSLAKFTRLLAKPVYMFAKINHVSSECCCSS